MKIKHMATFTNYHVKNIENILQIVKREPENFVMQTINHLCQYALKKTIPNKEGGNEEHDSKVRYKDDLIE